MCESAVAWTYKQKWKPLLLHLGQHCCCSLHEDVSPPGVLQRWGWKSLKISPAFVVVGSLLSSLPWPPRPPFTADPPLPLWGLVSVRRPYFSARPPPPQPLKGLSLISMPLGLLGRLLPNKHSQDLLPRSPLSACSSVHLAPSILLYLCCFEQVVPHCIIPSPSPLF